MQSEKPKIYIIFREISTPVKTIIKCFIKDELLNTLNIYEIEEMYFGTAINASKCDLNVLCDVKIKCLDFYLEDLSQML